MESGKCSSNSMPAVREDGRIPLVIPRDGDEIHADLEPPRSGEARLLLVLINGFQRPRADFRAFRRRLHEFLPHLATVALDNRGSGDSTLRHPEELTIRAMAADAAAVAEQVRHNLGLDGYAALGISMGGMISQELAAENQTISHLILVSTSPGQPLGHIPIPLPGAHPPPSPEAALARLERYFGREFFQSHQIIIRAFAKAVTESEQRPGATSAAAAQRRAVDSFDGSPLLGGIACPTLVLTGSDDRVIPPENSRALADNIPLTELIEYGGAGHLLLVEEPIRFAEDVARFLAPVI